MVRGPEQPSERVAVRMLTAADARVLDSIDEGVFDNAPRPDLVAAFFDDPSNLLAVALAGDLVVGMASGIAYVHPDKPRQLFVNEVGVSARWRRRGIARRLVTLLLDRARELGCTEAWVATEVDNAAARRLYDALAAAEEPERAAVYTWTLTDSRND